MSQDDEKRQKQPKPPVGAHFAGAGGAAPAESTKSSGASAAEASTDRSAGEAGAPARLAAFAGAKPDETSVYLDLARLRGLAGKSPDETSVYLSAASGSSRKGPSPEETAAFIIAANAESPVVPAQLSADVEDDYAARAGERGIDFDSDLPAPDWGDDTEAQDGEDDLFRGLDVINTGYGPVEFNPAPRREGLQVIDASGAVVGGAETARDASAPGKAGSGPVAATAAGSVSDEDGEEDEAAVLGRAEKSSNMVSLLVILSRVTGFFRTTAQAWAIGATMLASCYTIATQLPNVMYELVVGGMLITSFLPVYVKVRDRVGKEGAGAYASNLLSVMLILMVALTAVSFVFAGPIIWTQSAGAAKSFDADLAIWFFRWFCVEIILYALSSVFSGVLNAERDYLWSNAAPVFNNIIVITAFGLYGGLTRAGVLTPSQAMIILALGNPLGVATQVLVQVPALRRHGVRLRLRADFHDPALRETLSIGLPTLVVTLAAYPTNAVMSSSMMSVTDAGAAIIYYARVWYVLPFSIFAIPISVTMFTELSHYFVRGDMASFVSSFSRGASKILFTTIPFTFYFIVFAGCLISVISGGSFAGETAGMTADYLAYLSLTLPFYALSIYLQKTCSALLSMKFFAMATVVAAVVQVAVCLALTPIFGMPVVPLSSAAYFIVLDFGTLVRLRGRMGKLGLRAVAVSVARSIVFGAAGAATGWGILQALIHFVGPMQGVLRAALYAVAGGVPALVVTFGLATLLNVSDAPFFDSIFRKLLRRAPAAA